MEGKELVGIASGYLDAVQENQLLLARRRIASIILDDKGAPKVKGMPPRVILAVDQNDMEKAKAVLGEKFDEMIKEEGVKVANLDLNAELCPACGTPISADVEECPECGLAIVKA
jgi:hypothetical protein